MLVTSMAALAVLGALATPAPADFPSCPATARQCVGLTFHLAHDDAGKPLASQAWIARQLAHANRLFAAVGLGFEVAGVERVGATEARVVSRRDRDRLGHERFRRGTVHVFLVTHLANVDEPGIIRGVHWRDRGDVRRRWVILANYAMTWVLAHELGHFFGLPHSRYRDSVMNKRPRARPRADDRRFVASEQAKLRADIARQLEAGMVVARRPQGGRR